MTPTPLEQVLDRVLQAIRPMLLAELTRTITGGEVAPVPVPQPAVYDPFNMSDAQLRQAERLLSAEEGRVLRMRVMAARLDNGGNRGAAQRLRGKADRLERQLQLNQKAA